jgi:hypothetical protein
MPLVIFREVVRHRWQAKSRPKITGTSQQTELGQSRGDPIATEAVEFHDFLLTLCGEQNREELVAWWGIAELRYVMHIGRRRSTVEFDERATILSVHRCGEQKAVFRVARIQHIHNYSRQLSFYEQRLPRRFHHLPGLRKDG